MLKSFRNTIKYCRPERISIIIVIVLRLAMTIISVVQPLIYASMITFLLNKRHKNLLVFMAFLVVSYLLAQLINFVLKRTEAKTAKKMNYYVKAKVTEYLLVIPNYRMSFNQGKMYSVLVSDTKAVYSAVSVMISLFFTVLNVIGIGLVAVCINWQLCLILMIPYPFILIINRKYRKIIKNNAVDVINQNDEYINHVKNMIGNICDIKNQNGCSKILQKVCGEAKKGTDLSIKQRLSQTKFDSLVSVTGVLGHIILTVVGVQYVYMGIIPFGNFVAFNNYSKSLSTSIETLLNAKTNLQPLMVSVERVFELEELSRESWGSENKKEAAKNGIDSLCFRNVSLAYGEKEILHKINLHLVKGKIVGFIGKNGSGKTSMMNLIMQNILPTGGELLINGNNMENYQYYSLRKHFEYIGVKQNVYYLTVYDNIALAEDEFLKEEKIRHVCEEVGLLQDINALTDSFNMQIRDENMFSTGQAKKLQIARAFIKNSSVLILDEALSNLDDATKTNLAARLREMAENKIIVLISHNKEDYRICDEIYQIKDGSLEKVHNLF